MNRLKRISSNIINSKVSKNIVVSKYNNAYRSSLSIFTSPVVSSNYSTLTKQTILNLYSKVNPINDDCYKIVFDEYNILKPKYALETIQFSEVEHVLYEISVNSEIIEFSNGKYFFKDAFHKAYTRIKTIDS